MKLTKVLFNSAIAKSIHIIDSHCNIPLAMDVEVSAPTRIAWAAQPQSNSRLLSTIATTSANSMIYSVLLNY